MFHVGHAASLELSSLWNVPQTHVVMVVTPIYHIELHKCTNLHAGGGVMDHISIKTTNPKCRLYFTLRPSNLLTCSPTPPPPFPYANKYKGMYSYSVTGGGRGSGASDR